MKYLALLGSRRQIVPRKSVPKTFDPNFFGQKAFYPSCTSFREISGREYFLSVTWMVWCSLVELVGSVILGSFLKHFSGFFRLKKCEKINVLHLFSTQVFFNSPIEVFDI